MRPYEFEKPADELIDVKIESSEKMRDRGKESLIQEGIIRGNGKEIFSPTPLSWSASVHARRLGLTSRRGVNWFDFEDPTVDESRRCIRFTLFLDVPLVQNDFVVRNLKLDDSEVGEVIGFYLKLCALRHEVLKKDRKRDLLFQGRALSDYKLEAGGDELWVPARVFYISQVLRKDWKPDELIR